MRAGINRVLMSRTRIKICGITRPEDGLAAAEAGADAIGLVFYPDSPRFVSLEVAETICDALPPFVSIVALFVNAAEIEIDEVLRHLPIDTVQLHGDETPGFVQRLGFPCIKAISVKESMDVASSCAEYAEADAVLLDTYQKGVPGGTGQRFDWDLVPPQVAPDIILAGGLNSDNVADAIRTVGPYAVDVSGGVESAPGIKDAQKISDFAAAVRAADAERQA